MLLFGWPLFGGSLLRGLVGIIPDNSPDPLVPEPAVEVDSLPDLLIVVAIMSSVLSSVLVIRDTVKPPIWRGHCRGAAIWRGLLFRG